MSDCPVCGKSLPPAAQRCPFCQALLHDAPPAPAEASSAMTELAERLRPLLAAHRKIEAIKLYREATGSGLAEAKRAVEDFEAHGVLPEPWPHDPARTPSSAAEQRGGCFGAALLTLTVGAAFAWRWLA